MGTGAGSGFLQGVPRAGLARDSEGFLPWTDVDLRVATGGSGARVTTDDRRDLVAIGTPLALMLLEFNDALTLAETEGKTQQQQSLVVVLHTRIYLYQLSCFQLFPLD